MATEQFSIILMKTIKTILTSGIINGVKFNETFQTADSNVYSFRFETTDEDGHWSINGYVQTTNKNHNAVINGKNIHAFDCFITNY